MEGNTLQNELLKYFNFDPNAPTKSAFIQQRAKVLPEAFEYLFFMFTQKIADIMPLKTLRGYRIVAADGTDIKIPECCECVYQIYCGTCPVITYMTEGNLFSSTPNHYRCKVYKGIIKTVLKYLVEDEEPAYVLRSWLEM